MFIPTKKLSINISNSLIIKGVTFTITSCVRERDTAVVLGVCRSKVKAVGVPECFWR